MIEIVEFYRAFYRTGIATDPWFLLLFIVVVLDILFGSARAWVLNEYNSRKSREGIVTHGGILLVMGLIYPFLLFLGLGGICNGFMAFLTLSYFSSIIGNWVLMGGYCPKGLQEFLATKLNREFENKYEKYAEKIDERFMEEVNSALKDGQQN